MPIINRPSETTSAAPEKKGILPKSDTASSAPERLRLRERGEKKPLSKNVIIAVACIAVSGVAAAAYAFIDFQGLSLLPSAADDGTTDAHLSVIAKTGALIALTEQQILNNKSALDRAIAGGHDVIADTLKLALEKNLNEMEEYKRVMARETASLYDLYSDNENVVNARFSAAVKKAAAEKAPGRVNVLSDTLVLLRKAAEQQEPYAFITEHFSS